MSESLEKSQGKLLQVDWFVCFQMIRELCSLSREPEKSIASLVSVGALRAFDLAPQQAPEWG